MGREKGWFREIREENYPTAAAAAKACGVSAPLIEWLERGSVTAPELAKRIGKVIGLTREQVSAITCQATVARREIERHYSAQDKIVMGRH